MQYSAFLTTLLLPLLSTSRPLAERDLAKKDLAPRQQVIWGAWAGTQNAIDPSGASDYALTLENGQDGGVCGGFWDNLHGTCGDGITSMNCVSTNGTANIAFTVPVTCQGWQIQNTAWVASEPHIGGVECSWTTWWPSSEGAGPEAGAGVLEAIFEGAPELLSFGGEK